MSTQKLSITTLNLQKPAEASRTTRIRSVAAVATLSAFLLAGCSGGNTSPAEAGTESSQQSTEENHGDLKLELAWAKAAKSGDMTSVFGTLDNGSGTDAHITQVSSTVSEAVELHETYLENGTTKMREIDGGFVVPAHDTFELEPGGSHIMLMDLNQDLLAGDTLTLELMLEDGSTYEVSAEIRDFAGANEDYGDLESHDHDHDHDHSE